MVKTTNQWYFLGAKTQGSLTSRGRAQEPNHWSCWLIRMYRIVPMERFLDRPSQIGKIRVWNPPTRSQKLLDSFSSSNIMFSPWRTKPCQRHAPCCGKNLLRNRAFLWLGGSMMIWEIHGNHWTPSFFPCVFQYRVSVSNGFSIDIYHTSYSFLQFFPGPENHRATWPPTKASNQNDSQYTAWHEEMRRSDPIASLW